jgi:hypothetical protein
MFRVICRSFPEEIRNNPTGNGRREMIGKRYRKQYYDYLTVRAVIETVDSRGRCGEVIE